MTSPHTAPRPSSNAMIDAHGDLALAGWVTELDDDEIFVFGSNAAGMHAGGAAAIAHRLFGAEWGNGHGLQGRSYAVDTMTNLDAMLADIQALLMFATEHPELQFLVTELGCGIGPYQPADVAPAFRERPSNIALPESFLTVLRGE